jgi:LacI family transcriptional regulator
MLKAPGHKALPGVSLLLENMANLKEVAELAGVSIATASMALRGGGNLRESTRIRVRTCAKRLNYTPNQIGRTLNTGKANAIALGSAK